MKVNELTNIIGSYESVDVVVSNHCGQYRSLTEVPFNSVLTTFWSAELTAITADIDDYTGDAFLIVHIKED